MDLVARLLGLTAIIAIALVAIVTWLWWQHPYYLISWWNQCIKSECDRQDAQSLNGIPSYQDAWSTHNKTVVELHRLLIINHDEILAEVMEWIDEGLESSSPSWLKAGSEWDPIWIRFMGNWMSPPEKLPTLKRIISLFPEIVNFQISIFHPGNTVVEYSGPSRATYRYHYGLKVPENDIGLKIADYDVQWKEKEGYVWDDTIPHSDWNHTTEPRIVIFADVLRDFSMVNALGTKMIYSLLQRTTK